MISIIAIASIASITVLGNTQTAYAGAPLVDCDDPVPSEVRLTLAPGESSETILKNVTCQEDITKIFLVTTDCTNQGIEIPANVDFVFPISISVVEWDETITNAQETIGEIHCNVQIFIELDNAEPVQEGILIQEIWITTPEPPVVGGELLPLNTTALLLAGAQSFSWMIPVVLSVLGIGLFVVSRKSE